MAFKRLYFSKFSRGACPRTPLGVLTRSALVGRIDVRPPPPPQKKFCNPVRLCSCLYTDNTVIATSSQKMHALLTIDLFHNDVKRGFQDDTRNLIGSAIMKVLFKPIKFRLTSRFPRLTSL